MLELLEGRLWQVGSQSLLPGSSHRTRGSGLKLHEETCRLDSRKKFLTEKVVKHWNKQHIQLVDSPSLEVFKRHADMVIRYMFLWQY